ncbi:hypothetical protein ES702_03381 [subsurface metagenome]
MAKKTGLGDIATLGTKKKLPTKNIIPEEKIEQIAKDIEEGSKENNVRVTIDIPEGEYLKMKIKIAGERRTVRDYFLDLMNKDLLGE